MMEVALNSETSVNFYQTTPRCNPEDSHLQLWSQFEDLVHFFVYKVTDRTYTILALGDVIAAFLCKTFYWERNGDILEWDVMS
jgi:hypothetical protein